MVQIDRCVPDQHVSEDLHDVVRQLRVERWTINQKLQGSNFHIKGRIKINQPCPWSNWGSKSACL